MKPTRARGAAVWSNTGSHQSGALRLQHYLLPLLVYAALACLAAAFIYFDQRRSHYELIESRLEAGIQAGQNLLPLALHDAALSGESLSIEREWALSNRLTELANSLGLVYLYSMVLVDEQISFVLSSLTEAERTGTEEFEREYLRPYRDADPALRSVWSSGDSQTLSYRDSWGEFLSLFVPVTTPQGNVVVIGADVDIAEVHQLSRSSALRALGFLLLIGLVTLPLIWALERARRRQLQLEISSLYTDQATGLANRSQLMRDIAAAEHPQLAMLDIIRFREISDGYGVALGDMVLQAFARHLELLEDPSMPPHRTYRVDGDVFALLIDHQELPANPDAVFSRMIKHVAHFAYRIHEGELLRLQVRFGLVLGQQHDVLALADHALMQAREQKRALIVWNQQTDRTDRYQKARAKSELIREALRTARIVPHFQPMLRCGDGQIDRYEVLARMLTVDQEPALPPNEFVPIAHRYHFYYQITRTIVSQTLEKMAGNNACVSFNLSIRDIEQPATAKFLIDAVRRSGYGRRISFEVLENEAIHDMSKATQFFTQMRTLGCQIGIDDLGKEYSNFDRVIQLPVDFVKLDGQVMHHAAGDAAAFQLVRDVVNMARGMSIKTVAEYVSAPEVLDKAVDLGVDLVQGFHIGQPAADLPQIASSQLLRQTLRAS